jgi:hypothetical protein
MARRKKCTTAEMAEMFAAVYRCPCRAEIAPIESTGDGVHHIAVIHSDWCPELIRRRARWN